MLKLEIYTTAPRKIHRQPRNFIPLLSAVTFFFFSAESTLYVIMFWLWMASSILSSATDNLCHPSSREWFLMHAWPAGRLGLGLCRRWCRLSHTTLVFQGEQVRWWQLLVFALHFCWAGCRASNSCQQGGLLTCLRHWLHADTRSGLSSNSARYNFPRQGVSLLLSSTLYSFRTEITAHTYSTSSSPHFGLAIQQLELYLPVYLVHIPVYHIMLFYLEFS